MIPGSGTSLPALFALLSIGGSIAGGIPIDNIGLGTIGVFAGVVGAAFVPAIRGALVRSIR